MRRWTAVWIVTLIMFGGAVAFAEEPEPQAQAQTGSDFDGFGYRAWGLRIGLADSPDQFLFGAHVDLGYFAKRVRFQPDVELGFGDDFTTIVFTAPVHYMFKVNSSVQPYAGGGVAAGFFDRKNGGSDFEIGLKIAGGAIWTLKNSDRLFVELDLGIGDVHDAQLVFGWTF